MENNFLLEHIKSALNLSEKQIREKFAEYPICLMEYIEKEVNEKSIEIRFDNIEITLTCIFNNNGVCNQVYLFPDNNEMIKDLISYFEKAYKFDYLRGRWIGIGFNIKVKPIVELPGDYCLLFQN